MTDKYEWDEAKRQKTLRERGFDFADVVYLDWNTAVTKQDLREEYSEPRYITVGLIDGRLYVCAWCLRHDKIRIISLRKANNREKGRYENE